MNERLIFEAEPFETYSSFEADDEEQPDTYPEFDTEEEESDAEPTLLEWEEEARRGRAFGSRRAAPRLRTPPRRHPPKNRPRPPKRRPRPVIRRRPRPRVVVREPSIDDRPPEGTEYIRWVQSSLNSIMGLQLPVNGVMGVETRSAVRSFQRREGLPVDGMVGPETERALIASRAGQSPAPSDDATEDADTEVANLGWEDEVDRSGRDYVHWVQQSLNRILRLRLAEDGLLGPHTRSAIRSFQRRQRLPVDGIVGPKTRQVLIAARSGIVGPDTERALQRAPCGGQSDGESKFESENRSSGSWRMVPPEISSSLPHCWAAALSSWSQRTRHLPRLSTRDYVERVRARFPDRVDKSGALIGEQGLEALKVMFGLCMEKTEHQMMSLSYLKPKLRKSYVLIVFKIGPADAVWHTVLIYGVDRFSLCFMDPLLGRRRCEPQWNFGIGDPIKYVLWRC